MPYSLLNFGSILPKKCFNSRELLFESWEGLQAESVGKFLGKKLNSTFDRFWLDQINVAKLDSNGVDHNKLRFYKTLKGSFTQEPYVTNIKNKSQRAWLTRFRVSAVSNLRIESGRYTRPVTPITARICRYCDSDSIDDEKHLG